MRANQTDFAGFMPPRIVSRGQRRRAAVAIELLMTLTLLAAIGVMSFVVSMEMAEAGPLTAIHPAASSIAVIALLSLLAGTGGLTAFMAFAPICRRTLSRRGG